MKEILAEELVKLINKSEMGIMKGIDFAKEQSPDLIKEIYKFEIIDNILGLFKICSLFILNVGILTGCVYLAYKYMYKIDACDQNILYFMFIIIGLLVSAGFTITAILEFFNTNYVSNIIQIKIAPKLYLLNYIKNFIE